MKLYHATALNNADGILKKGFLIEQRGINPYGLDTGVDYYEVYETPEQAQRYIKPPCIHFVSSLEDAQQYSALIRASYNGVNTVIFEVEIDEDIYDLYPDVEDSQGYISTQNIPSSCIVNKITPLVLQASTKSETVKNVLKHINFNSFLKI